MDALKLGRYLGFIDESRKIWHEEESEEYVSFDDFCNELGEAV